ncbi:MAG: 23S rRNA (adenine(2030)-N(6))-methyltransferase RlmJ [Alphaproteobacteria bacterium]|nr:23S rRNA (adenine(2030)-N(6))-methyltransferase RlmJ [Alphaproteobacteria bacterium]
MNYRHAFHAGNHCDVLKHTALALVLEALGKKAKPFVVLDAFAGRGRYDLTSPEAMRSSEAAGGIGAIFHETDAPISLSPYLDAVRRENPSGMLRWYPGSPALAAEAIRAGDRLVACDLHPEEARKLEHCLETFPNARAEHRDGYQAIRAFLPFPERRSLVLIDPPFERPGEFDRLASALLDIRRRFATCVVVSWYPIKGSDARTHFEMKVAEIGFENVMSASLEIAGASPLRLTGSALLVVNPPYGLSDALSTALSWIAHRLKASEGAGWRVAEWEGRHPVFERSEVV